MTTREKNLALFAELVVLGELVIVLGVGIGFLIGMKI